MRRLWPMLLACLVGCDCQPPRPMDDAGVDAGDPGVLEIHFEQFGEVLRGNSLEHPVTFKNTRPNAIELTGLSVSGAGFSLVGPSALQIPSGGEASVRVRFSPVGLGRQDGALAFVDGSPDEVVLIGTGIGPSLELTPAQLDLGTIALYDGAAATASGLLTVSNVGLRGTNDTPLQLFFEVQSTSTAPAEELCADDCSGAGVSVDAGTSAQIFVRLATTTPGVKTWELQVLSNDPTRPIVTVPVSAEIVARPTCQFVVASRLSFGLMSAPETRELEVVLENVGTENCEVTQVELGNELPPQAAPLFSIAAAPTLPRQVAPGELLRVTVRATPQGRPPAAPRMVTGELRLALNHPDGFARVPLELELGLGCLLVSPSPVDFGTVATGCRSADRTVSFMNRCSHAIDLTSASLPGLSSFSLSAALPVQLLPNGFASLTARFTPFAAGPSRDVIDVAWLDNGQTRHTTVPLIGEANATGENVDHFPAGTGKLDLLLVLDDSCSMAPIIPTRNTQLPRLLTALLSRNVDFQLGVIDAVQTGSSDAGVLRRTSTGLRWLGPTTPNLSASFTELTAFTMRQEGQSCEDAVLLALTAPNASDPMINGGFLRTDSMLSVICVTDKVEPYFLIDHVMQAAGPDRRFSWDDVTLTGPSTPQCPGQYSPRAGQLGYRELTGGQLLDLCSTDWSPLLDVVAERAIGTRTFFPLAQRPDLLGALPLSVSVAGQNVSASSDAGTQAWGWESAPNAVVFAPIFAPLSSQPVSISYGVSCMP